MGELFASHSYAASERSDDTAVHDCPGPVFNAPHPDIKTTQTGIGAGVRSHANLVARSQDGLTSRSFDCALVVDIRPDQHDAATTPLGRHTGADLRAALHYNITIAPVGRCGGRDKGRGAIASTWNFDRRENELGIAIVEQTLLDKVVVDW